MALNNLEQALANVTGQLKPSVANSLNTAIQFGTMFTVSRLIQSVATGLNGKQFLDQKWLNNVMTTIVGFAVYFMFVKDMVPMMGTSETLVNMQEDLVANMTMMGFTHVVNSIQNGTSLSNFTNMKSNLNVLVGLAGFHLVTRNFMPRVEGPSQAIVKDWVRVGTMLLISNGLSGGKFDENWLMTSFSVLLGFTAYRVFTQNLLNASKLSS